MSKLQMTVLVILLVSVPSLAHGQTPALRQLPIQDPVRVGEVLGRLCGAQPEVRVAAKGGRWFGVVLAGEGVLLVPRPVCAEQPLPEDPERLPDGLVSGGAGEIVWAWLAEPTGRYAHGILGDAIEAGALQVQGPGGQRWTFRLPSDSVFEDRLARPVDLDRDGRDEVLVIRSSLEQGASLALFGLRNNKLEMLAASEPIGRSYRWLNIVGVADFDGDGQREIAVVLTPHIGGTLALYAWQGERLVRKFASEGFLKHGFSNHAIGSREQGMGAVLDADGDGVTDMVVPGADRTRLRVMSFAGGRIRELGTVEHARPIVTGIHLLPKAVGKGAPTAKVLIYGLDDGSLRALAVSRP